MKKPTRLSIKTGRPWDSSESGEVDDDPMMNS